MIPSTLLIEVGSTRSEDGHRWRCCVTIRWYHIRQASYSLQLTSPKATVNEMESEESFQNISVIQEISQ